MQTKIIKYIVQVIFLCFSVLLSFGQKYNFYNYNKDNGLAQSHISAIFQDSRGYIWIGTESCGINVYDGFSIKTYTTQQGLPDNKIKAIYEDSHGCIWVGTKSGYLSCFNGAKFTNYSSKDGLEDNNIVAIVEDFSGVLWVGTQKGGLYRKTDNKFIKISYTSDTLNIIIEEIFVAKNGDLWLGRLGTKRHGLFVKQNNGFRNISVKDGLCNNKINCISEDKQGHIWIATRYGVSRFNGRNFKNYYQSNGLPSSFVTSILCDNNGNMWFGTYGFGACRCNITSTKVINCSSFTYFNQKNGLCNDFIRKIIQDKSGNIWFSTDGGGVCKLDGEFLLHYTTGEGLPDNYITAVIEDKNNNLWFGTEAKGLCCFTGKEFSYFTKNNGLCSNAIHTIFIDTKGILWIGSKEYGVSIYDNGRLSKLSENNGLSGNIIQAITEDKFGNIWLGSYGGGITIYNGNTFTYLTKKNGFASDLIKTILEDEEGNIWVGTEDEGVIMIFKEHASDAIFSKGKLDEFGFLNIKSNYGLSSNNVVALVQDNNGCIWIGTMGGGVGRFDGKRIYTYTEQNGLCSNDTRFLIFDSYQNLWIGTEKGLNIIRYNIKSKEVEIEDYSQGSGFINQESKVHTGYEDHDGNVWFGTSNGVSLYIPEKDAPNQEPPQIHITAIKLFSETTDWSRFDENLTAWNAFPQNLKLPYNKNHLKFEFLGTDLKAPNKVRYQWMLEGFDKDWSIPSLKNNCTYSYIPFGNYSFKVKAINKYGIPNKTPAVFNFTVLPPFWANWRFYSAIFIVILLLVFIYIRWKQIQLVKEKKLLEQKVDERTKLLQQEKMTVELQKDQLTKQKQLLEQVNKELIKLSIVAAKTSNAVVIFDSNAYIEWANDGFLLMYDYSLDDFNDLINKSIYEKSNNPNIRQAVQTCIETKGSGYKLHLHPHSMKMTISRNLLQ
ncbi:MAG: hypothetical protein HY738_01330 [Bacteroidia bacterium]|nr:hypothetical protein [Bacteroidia bacterium]